jgi:hypothetical protein
MDFLDMEQELPLFLSGIGLMLIGYKLATSYGSYFYAAALHSPYLKIIRRFPFLSYSMGAAFSSSNYLSYIQHLDRFHSSENFPTSKRYSLLIFGNILLLSFCVFVIWELHFFGYFLGVLLFFIPWKFRESFFSYYFFPLLGIILFCLGVGEMQMTGKIIATQLHKLTISSFWFQSSLCLLFVLATLFLRQTICLIMINLTALHVDLISLDQSLLFLSCIFFTDFFLLIKNKSKFQNSLFYTSQRDLLACFGSTCIITYLLPNYLFFDFLIYAQWSVLSVLTLLMICLIAFILLSLFIPKYHSPKLKKRTSKKEFQQQDNNSDNLLLLEELLKQRVKKIHLLTLQLKEYTSHNSPHYVDFDHESLLESNDLYDYLNKQTTEEESHLWTEYFLVLLQFEKHLNYLLPSLKTITRNATNITYEKNLTLNILEILDFFFAYLLTCLKTLDKDDCETLMKLTSNNSDYLSSLRSKFSSSLKSEVLSQLDTLSSFEQVVWQIKKLSLTIHDLIEVSNYNFKKQIHKKVL